MHPLELYQIVIAILAATMLAQGVHKYVTRSGNQTLLKLGIRFIIWGGMIVVVLFPKVTNVLAEIIGIQGNLNAVILVGFLLVFLMIFKLLSAIEKLERQITLLTKNEALTEIREDN